MTIDANDEGTGGTVAGPSKVRDAELADNAEAIAVPQFDIVGVAVEGLVDPAADAVPGAEEPADGPDVSSGHDPDARGGPTDEHAGDAPIEEPSTPA